MANKAGQKLDISSGLASETGRRPRNEDYAGVYSGEPAERARRGIAVVIADGVGGAKAGRVAAEIAVRQFIDGYYGQRETLGIRQSAAQALASVNRWIYGYGQLDPALEGMASTLTALILHGQKAHSVHVGDTRIYRLSEDRLERLTEDHTPKHPDSAHILLRAVGLEDAVRLDYGVHPVRPLDRFLLCSDGVHGVLRDAEIHGILALRTAPEEAARRLVAMALDAGGQDNATALVIDILSLPPIDRGDLELAIGALPILKTPSAGQIIDRYALESVLSEGRYSRLFRAVDLADTGRRRVVLKFPKPPVASETTYRMAFLREAWVAARVRSPWVGECLDVTPGRQTQLYSVMPYYEGETLEQRLRRAPKLSAAAGVGLTMKLAKAVAALHRAKIVHRDIKPDNIILESGAGGLKLIDLGVVRLTQLDDFPESDIPGTASYMAPELFAGQKGSELSDQFALGVTVFRALSGGPYPYGEIEPFSHPRFAKPHSVLSYRPDLPSWLDAILAKAISVDPNDRFRDVLEFAFELESGLARGGGMLPPKKLPLYHRNPLRFWQGVSLILFALAVWLIARR